DKGGEVINIQTNPGRQPSDATVIDIFDEANAHCYLEKQGRSVEFFRNNLPGRDWVKLFMKRHPHLSIRFANNIKRARSTIDETVITQYVDNLSDLTKDVPPDRIYNYDETCMSDDSGWSKIICRRGCKYPERVINSTKSTVTVMLCGNAAGSSISPYIIYKAGHLWITWVGNGPMGTTYNRMLLLNGRLPRLAPSLGIPTSRPPPPTRLGVSLSS
ncbi:hypothetical protein J437_LFUL019377, partial [Ladona fulva]